MNAQYTSGKHIDRKLHVWHKQRGGLFKCVLCGGITRNPAEDAEIVVYELLTDEERALCPFDPIRLKGG